MACTWKYIAHIMVTVNAVLIIITLMVCIVSISPGRLQPKTCQHENRANGTELMFNKTRETMNKAVKERMAPYQDAKYFRSLIPLGPKPFAHVVLASIQADRDNADLRWDPNHNMSQLNGVEYLEDGHLHIPGDGYYFVYSNLDFMERAGHELGRDFIRHRFFRTDNHLGPSGLRKKLQKELHIFNEMTQPNMEPGTVISSQIGAILYLPGNSTLSVTTSLPDSLHPDCSRSYLEVYLV